MEYGPITGNGLDIFVVEDEVLLALVLEEMLRGLGHRVVHTAHGEQEALTVAEAMACDLCILDVNLSGTLSDAVATRMQALGIPVLLSTGYGDRALPPEFGCLPILKKPYLVDELEQAIARITAIGATGAPSKPAPSPTPLER